MLPPPNTIITSFTMSFGFAAGDFNNAIGDLAFGYVTWKDRFRFFKGNFSNGRERIGRPTRRRNSEIQAFTEVEITKISTTTTLEDRQIYRQKLDQLYQIASQEKD